MPCPAATDDRRATHTVHLPRDPRSVRHARGFVRDRLQEWDLAALVDDAQLVVTELATNAVVHAHSSYSVSATRTPHAVRLAVRDAGSGTVRTGAWTDRGVSGRGLLLVDALSADWGVSADEAGKTVWADLAA